MTNNELLSTSVSIGYYMLQCGAEIYRIEDSIKRICTAYGVKSIEVFAIPSSIIVTLTSEDNQPLSMIKRVHMRDFDLDKLDRLNNLSRYICSNKPSLKEITERIEDIKHSHVYKNAFHIIAYGFVASIFCLYFGGSVRDMTVAFFIGLVIKILLDKLAILKSNYIFTNLICSFFGSCVAIISIALGIADNIDKISIGAIMTLVPGITITNSMRDFIMGDLLAGIIEMIEALLVATGIAIGVALALAAVGGISS